MEGLRKVGVGAVSAMLGAAARAPRVDAPAFIAEGDAVSAMRSAVCEAFRDMGAAEDEAPEAAPVLGKRDEDVNEAPMGIESDIAGVEGGRIARRWRAFAPASGRVFRPLA